jgi:hypothetical protein
LQALAKAKGGSLTLNPETGLPEAGFLEDILPILAAGAATYFTAGAATPMLMSAGLGSTSAGILAGAGSGALISGGMAAMQGQDAGKAALMGGLGGALAGGMGSFGGAEGAVGTGINPNAGVGIDPNAGLTQSTQVGTQALNLNPQTGSIIDPLAGIKVPTSATSVPAGYGINANTPVQATTYGARDTASSILNAPQASYSMAPPPPPTPAAAGVAPGKEGFFASMSPMGKAATVAGGAALLSELANPQGTGFEEDSYESRLKRISPDFRAQVPMRPNPAYSAQYPVYAAGGGGVDDLMMAAGGSYDDEPRGDSQGYGFVGGGIASLGGYSDGGRMLKGPGDGMSDSIPAMIGKKQPARLADGEFVVPADVVSHLGNGSTDAGAKKLYAMMDKVRQARTGKKRQAPAVKTDKYVPA